MSLKEKVVINFFNRDFGIILGIIIILESIYVISALCLLQKKKKKKVHEGIFSALLLCFRSY